MLYATIFRTNMWKISKNVFLWPNTSWNESQNKKKVHDHYLKKKKNPDSLKEG